MFCIQYLDNPTNKHILGSSKADLNSGILLIT